MKKVLAIILSVTMILGCAVLCTSAKFGDTVTESNAVVEISDYGTTTVLLAKQTTAVDDSDDTIQHGVALSVGADPNGYSYFDNVRAGDNFTFKANINTAGVYNMALNFGWAAHELVGDFSVYVDGVQAASVINEVVGLNWQEWTLSTSAPVTLEEGEHEIKIVVDCYAINLSALCIAPLGMAIEPEYPNLLSKSPVIEEEEAEFFAVDVTYGTFAYRFIANAPFDGIGFMLGTNDTIDSKCEISLFNYDTNYEKTLENDPIVTHMQDPLADNSLIEISTNGVLPAGEYLAYIDATMLDEDEEVAIYAYLLLESYPTGFIYVDGELWEDVVPTIIVNFTQELDSGIYFGQCEVGEDVPGDDFWEDEDTTDAEQGGDDTATPDVDDTATPDVDGTAAPEVDGTAAPEVDGTAAGTVAAGTEAGTEAGTGATGTKAPATTTAAAASEGCKAVVGSMSAIALVAIASAAAVVLKKKED